MGSPRTKSLSTRLLLLLEVHNQRHTRLRTLAERLDVTIQAVSDYLKRLSNEGLVESVGGVWRPTKLGTALLHDTMRDLRTFVDQAMGSLQIIEETLAIADRRLRSEQEVGLFLRDGRLVAGAPRGASSRGRTRTDAGAGQLVLVGDLKGILEIPPAPLTFIAHPDFPTPAGVDKVRRQLRRHRARSGRTLVAAHSTSSLAWAAALGLPVDLEFAPLAAAQEAAQRGVSVLYFVPASERAVVEAQLRAATGARRSLPLRSVEA